MLVAIQLRHMELEALPKAKGAEAAAARSAWDLAAIVGGVGRVRGGLRGGGSSKLSRAGYRSMRNPECLAVGRWKYGSARRDIGGGTVFAERVWSDAATQGPRLISEAHFFRCRSYAEHFTRTATVEWPNGSSPVLGMVAR